MVARNSLFLVISIFFVFVLTGCQTLTTNDTLTAAVGLTKALTVSDEDVKQQSKMAAEAFDKRSKVASSKSKYQQRVNKLTQNLKTVDGHQFNYKVYVSPEINAMAYADGSIRIYSGLMDNFNDDELLFVIGHEIGHVTKGHSRNKMRTALLSMTGRDLIVAGTKSSAGPIPTATLADFGKQVIDGQYSQQAEREADDIGFIIVKQQGRNPKAAATSLDKLAALSSSNPNVIAQMVATHPNPKGRAERMRKAI